ncbi:3-isopropylmalate dehydrogenase [Montanilutibacter psychrotolerans]|uniref:3-isopropylmalate dehydrogenase n=1 Tax=Montanilutibacter psychrotolerans TaxID=1327343 RepID=A0A3M8ST33_9GAMM|nr:3-isopropylmalate dehydrogenase [Lysobacter psychrotolerans]RNF81922.1 3-isopropylmalate dehydrogenase [Lysobacter psychrotolerans]
MHAEIVVLPGDGIGPEVTHAAVQVLRAVARRHGHAFAFTQCLIGGAAIDATGQALPEDTLQRCREADAVLLGAVGGPKWSDPKAPVRPEQGLLAIRKALGLYANLRPVKPHPAAMGASPIKPHLLTGVDLVVVRELTGGVYFGQKTRTGSGASDLCEYTIEEIERVVRRACHLARTRRGHVVSVDKANVLETSRLWREVATRVAGSEFPDVTLEHQLVDSMAMHLLARPRDYDVIVTENMFGDILTDEASMLAGSLGLLPSASLGEGRVGLYEPIHGSAPDIAGRGIANPYAAILSAALLLRHSLGLEDEAGAIELAVSHALDAGTFTADLAAGDTAVGTRAATEAVLEHLLDTCYVAELRD